ncbi:MAG TPA: acetylglutamate kinase [Thermodesulfovibrionia bacterium]|nr:acetylglutamate kinase [Thermodesulfovibrionia bacterium]
METLIAKANILIEALPYIRKFFKKTFVIKYGGAAMSEPALKEAFAQDVVLLNFISIKPVIVHGGGPKINSIMEKMGKKPSFVKGQRVTDQDTMEIVEMVLGGLINKEIVSLINSHGGSAIGLTGKDGRFIQARKKVIERVSAETGESEIIDLGLVGEVEKVDPRVILSLQNQGFIPVIAPIGVGQENVTFNINADYVAASVASALKADKLVLLTDVSGILDMNKQLMPSLNAKDVFELENQGVISGGMIPKVSACLESLNQGVAKAHIIDGRISHALLLEIFTQKGIGTEIVL